MPIFRNNSVLELGRNLRAFLNLEAGVTRSGAPGGRNETAKSVPAPVASGGVRAEDIVWIFSYGSGRAGSTWLSRMFADLGNCALWHSPRVGSLFGDFYYDHTSTKRNKTRRDHIIGDEKDAWLGPVRDFILASAATRHPEFAAGRSASKYLVVTEPHGSIGAPILTEALPESRVILLMRDPRDVAASVLDGRREGSWIHETAKKSGTHKDPSDRDMLSLVKNHASGNVRSMEKAREAYDSHNGPKTLLKYEDLRADALANMRRAVSELGMSVDGAELARVVEKHSWENVPEDQKGEGKFYRKASPGGWKEDLSAEEIEIIESSFAPLIEEFYPARVG